MEELFNIIYDIYKDIKGDLTIGQQMPNSKLSKLWELINLYYYLKYGNVDRRDVLWIADHFKSISDIRVK